MSLAFNLNLASFHAKENSWGSLARKLGYLSKKKVYPASAKLYTSYPAKASFLFSCPGLSSKVEPVSTQIVPRDRLAQVMYALASTACALERQDRPSF